MARVGQARADRVTEFPLSALVDAVTGKLLVCVTGFPVLGGLGLRWNNRETLPAAPRLYPGNAVTVAEMRVRAPENDRP